MTTKTTFLTPEEIRSKLAQLVDATPPERATFVGGITFILDENGEQHLRLAMQGNISIEMLTNCLYNVIGEAMRYFLESRVPSDATMQ
ncbi:hypothetical protein [uncultured Desulfovibrio sp.]|uniref:hypothetical protein n=1 Tax=uncultured Desulfovibrio sp. TaxID=167968 RepID=UPI00263903B1|nr:hypothetical protein [uncultured Desulfovibrio sp.]